MRLKTALTLLLISWACSLHAQTSPQLNSSQIKQALNRLNVVGSALYIAAHPDDENTRLLAYLANEKKVRTGYLSITRGDGGQNLIGNEQAELLGVIRTQELLAARRTDGAEQFFTRANDFGFSKSAEESLKLWNKEKTLGDVVWAIRKFRPDVIITRFPEDSRAGHGQHWASALLAHEAFTAAADLKRFPEQLKYVKPWQATRLLWNTFNFGGTNTTGDDQLKIDIGAFNPLLGKGYGEIAAESRSNHKSQGFGSGKIRGKQFEFLKYTAGDAAKDDLFEGIDLSWARIEGGRKIQELIAKASKDYNQEFPSKSVPVLLSILPEIEKLKDEYWKTQKRKELKDLIEACAGLWFESYAGNSTYASGDSIPVEHQAVLRSDVPVKLIRIKTTAGILSKSAELNRGDLLSSSSKISVNAITQPYWLVEKHPIGYYSVNDQNLLGNPENPSASTVEYTFEIAGKPVSFTRSVVYKFTDPVEGEVYSPLTIAPPVTATINDKAIVFGDTKAKWVRVNLKSFGLKVSGKLEIKAPEGWSINPASVNFNFTAREEEQVLDIEVKPSENAQSGDLSIIATVGGKQFNNGLKIIDYKHIPKQTLFPAAETRLVKVNLKTTIKRVGYIAGAGDLVPESLKEIGLEVVILTENGVRNTDLSSLDAIITGIRTYNVNDRMKFLQPKLLEYVKSGGTLLVQYNTSGGLTGNQIGPYPFNINRDRITDETARVNISNPGHPVLNYPNKITEKDFEGWIQERGLYFVGDFDPKYTTLFTMNDPGEQTNPGSLILSDYGKGRFIYTSLSFFRQLPAGIPGAYRLFINLLSKRDR